MRGFKKFMEEVKDFFDEEKRIIVKKNIYQRKIDRIRRLEKARKELETVKKELDQLENGKDNK